MNCSNDRTKRQSPRCAKPLTQNKQNFPNKGHSITLRLDNNQTSQDNNIDMQQSKLKKQLEQLQSKYVQGLNKVNNLRSTNQAIGKTVQQLKIKSYCNKKQNISIDKENMNTNQINNDKKQSEKPKKRVINLYIKSKNQTDNQQLQLLKQKCQNELKELNQTLQNQLEQMKQTHEFTQQKNQKKIFEMQKLILQYKTLCQQILKRTQSHSKNKEGNNSNTKQRNSQRIIKKSNKSVNRKKKLNYSGMMLMQSEVFNVQPCMDHLKSAIQANKQTVLRKSNHSNQSNSKINPNSLAMLNQFNNPKKSNKLSLNNYASSNMQKNIQMFNSKRSEQIIAKDYMYEESSNSNKQFPEMRKSGSKLISKLSTKYHPNEQISIQANQPKKHSIRYEVGQPSFIENSLDNIPNRYGKNNFLSSKNLNHLNNSLGQQTTIKKIDLPQQSLNSSLEGAKYFVKNNYGSNEHNPKRKQTLNMLNQSIQAKGKLRSQREHSLSSCSLLGVRNKSYSKIVTRIACEGCKIQFGPTQYFNHIQQCREMEKLQLLKQRDQVSLKLQHAFQNSIL